MGGGVLCVLCVHLVGCLQNKVKEKINNVIYQQLSADFAKNSRRETIECKFHVSKLQVWPIL
jgi:hypothetical protein